MITTYYYYYYCLRAGLVGGVCVCGGEGGGGGLPVGEKIFIEFAGCWSAASLSMSFLQVFFMHYAEADYLPGF